MDASANKLHLMTIDDKESQDLDHSLRRKHAPKACNHAVEIIAALQMDGKRKSER